MTTKVRMILCVLAVTAPAWMTLRAGQPAVGRATGKVLVLDNERTLEGDIERVGEQYCIRRQGGELWIRTENALRLCESREEAYAYLRSRANLLDPDEYLRLARWCHAQGLRQQALENATAAVELRPNHAESRRFLRNLQHAGAGTPSQPPVKAPDQDGPAPCPQPPELSTESLSLFLSRVQPILMNTCASCHATGRGGAFKLTRTYESGMISRRTTQQNLVAVLAQINKERPTASALLTKAVSIHGKPGEMAQSPLKNREVPAYRSLEEWVRITLAKNPQFQEKASLTLVAERSSASESMVTAETTKAEPRDSATPSGAPAVAEPVDPYDPVIFNRQVRPK